MRARKPKHLQLQEKLIRANMRILAEDYDKKVQQISLILSVTLSLVGFLLAEILRLPFPFVFLLFLPMLYFLAYKIFLWYPSYRASLRASQIEPVLPHFLSTLNAMTASGLRLEDCFREISRRKKEFGELAVETERLVREMDYLGRDILSSIKSVSATTPSKHFKEFLDGLLPIVEAGGSIPTYCAEKFREYTVEYRGTMRRFLDLLGLLAELYVAIAIFGTLLFVVLLSLILVVANWTFAQAMLFFLVYLLPLFLTVIFITMIDFFAPMAPKVEPDSANPRSSRYKVPALRESTFEMLVKRPWLSALLGLPLVMPWFYWAGTSVQALVGAALLFLLPLLIFLEINLRRQRQIEEKIPDLLRALSFSMRSGVSLSRSLVSVARAPLGALSPEVERLHKDIRWTHSITESLERFALRLKNPIVNCVVSIINRSGATEEKLADVLEIASREACSAVETRKMREAHMRLYQIVMYISFFAFLFISYFLVLGVRGMVGVPETTLQPPSGMEAVGATLKVEQLRLLRSRLFHGSILQAVCIGLVMGKFTAGTVVAGIKHSFLMLVLAFMVFSYVIPTV
jgi:flagellar protein FlaJ